MTDDEFLDLEEETRHAFKAEFSREYLDHIDKDSTTTVLSEILWMGFAHGYMRSLHNRNDKSQQE